MEKGHESLGSGQKNTEMEGNGLKKGQKVPKNSGEIPKISDRKNRKNRKNFKKISEISEKSRTGENPRPGNFRKISDRDPEKSEKSPEKVKLHQKQF